MAPIASSAAASANAGIDQSSAYRRAISLHPREITRRLNASIGAALVSALAGSSDTKSSLKWAKANGPQPRQDSIKRLVFAYEQWLKVAEAEGEQVARVWFIGANPWLGYDTPVNAIRRGQFQQVAAAAVALADDSFNG